MYKLQNMHTTTKMRNQKWKQSSIQYYKECKDLPLSGNTVVLGTFGLSQSWLLVLNLF